LKKEDFGGGGGCRWGRAGVWGRDCCRDGGRDWGRDGVWGRD